MYRKTETYDEWDERMRNWHPWFAWHPVSWDGGFAWLEHLDRKMTMYFMDYQVFTYRYPSRCK